MDVRWLGSPVKIASNYSFESSECCVRRLLYLKYYSPNEYLEYFVIRDKEPVGVPSYCRERSKIYDSISIGKFFLPIRIFDRSRVDSFKMRWRPRCRPKDLERSIWFIVRVNLLLQIAHLQMENKPEWESACKEILAPGGLMGMVVHLLSRCANGMIACECGRSEPLNSVPHGDVPGRTAARSIASVSWRGTTSGVAAAFWRDVGCSTASDSLHRSAVKWAKAAFRRSKSDPRMVASAWQMAGLLNALRRCGNPDDEKARSQRCAPLLCRAVPVHDASIWDFVIDASREVSLVVNAPQGMAADSTGSPVARCVQWALPSGGKRKKDGGGVMDAYASEGALKKFIDSCILCVMLGVFGGAPNAEMFGSVGEMAGAREDIASGAMAKRLGESGVICAVRSYVVFAADRNQTIFLREFLRGVGGVEMEWFRAKCAEDVSAMRGCMLRRSPELKRIKFACHKNRTKRLEADCLDAVLNSICVYQLFSSDDTPYMNQIRSVDRNAIGSVVGDSRDVTPKIAELCGCSDMGCKFVMGQNFDGKAMAQLPFKDKYLLYVIARNALRNDNVLTYEKSPAASMSEFVFANQMPRDHCKPLFYETCCSPPSVLNVFQGVKCGKNETYVGLGCDGKRHLYCANYLKRAQISESRRVMDSEVMRELRVDIDSNMRKTFFYLSDRRYTYQLYQYLATGISNFPGWGIDGSGAAIVGQQRSDPSEVLLLDWRWGDDAPPPSLCIDSLMRDYRVICRVPPLYEELFANTERNSEMAHCKDFGIHSRKYTDAIRKLHSELKCPLVRADVKWGALSAMPGGWAPVEKTCGCVVSVRHASLPIVRSAEGVLRAMTAMLKREKHPINYIKKRLKNAVKLVDMDNECRERSLVGRVVVIKTRGGVKAYGQCVACGGVTESSLSLAGSRMRCLGCSAML